MFPVKVKLIFIFFIKIKIIFIFRKRKKAVSRLLQNSLASYFFRTYFKQSRVTATRIIIPEKINCKLVSIPKIVNE